MRRHLTLAVDQPAAGADWSFVPSTSDRVELLAVTATLTTAVAAANRIVALELFDQNDLTYWTADVVVAQTASRAVTYSWAKGTSLGVASVILAGERVAAPLPDLWLAAGDTVKAVTGAIAAADQWSNVVARYLVGDEWAYEQRLAAIEAALG